MAIRRTTMHPVVGTVEWETDKLESGHSIKLLNNFEKKPELIAVTSTTWNGERSDCVASKRDRHKSSHKK